MPTRALSRSHAWMAVESSPQMERIDMPSMKGEVEILQF